MLRPQSCARPRMPSTPHAGLGIVVRVTRTISPAQARRVAIAAQGLDRTRPPVVTMRHVTSTVERIGLLQIDSVNVLARAHLLPLLARLGPYDTALLDRAAGRAPRRLVEAWAHEACYLPVTTFPLVAWTRRRWAGMDPDALEARHPGVLELVRDVVAERGPLTAREVEAFVDARHAQRAEEGWGWRWSAARTALEILFDAGQLGAARRNAQFERVYDLAERVLPPHVRGQPPPDPDDAVRELVRISARAHGIGTVRCFADYFRLGQRVTRRAVDELVDSGELLPVTVAGWDRPAWLHVDAGVPRRTGARALLAPFDPLVFERRRLLSCSGCTTASGSTPRPPGAPTATTCCRSCSASPSSPWSTSSTTGTAASSWSAPPSPRSRVPTPPRQRGGRRAPSSSGSWRPSWRRPRRGWARTPSPWTRTREGI